MRQVLVFLLLFFVGLLVAQENNIVFYYDGKIICLNKDGKEVYPPYSVNNRVNGYYYTINKDGKRVFVYKLPGIEKLLGNERDTVISINTSAKLLAVVKTSGKYQIKDEAAKTLPIPVFDSLAFLIPVEDSLPSILVKKGDKYGVCDLNGKVLLSPEFTKIEAFQPGFYLVQKDEFKGLYTSLGLAATNIKYQEIGNSFDEGKLMCKRDELWGFIDKTGNEIIKPFLEKKPKWFYNGYCEITLNDEYSYDDLNGLMDSTGKIIIPMKYGSIYIDDSGFLVKQKYKSGFVSLKGKILLPAIYDEIMIINNEKMIMAVQGKKRLYFKMDGDKLSPTTEPKSNNTSSGWYAVPAKGKRGVMNPKGKIIVPPKYDDVILIDSTYYIFYNAGTFGLGRCDTVKEVAKGYKSIVNVPGYNSFVAKDKNSKQGVIDLQGRTTIPFIYDSIAPINCSPMKYESGKVHTVIYLHLASPINKGITEGNYYYVIKNGKQGFIDGDGKEIISCNKDDIGHFVNGTAIVREGNKYSLVSAIGKALYPTDGHVIDSLISIWPSMFASFEKGKYYLHDRVGKRLSEEQYDSIIGPEYNMEYFVENYYAYKNGKLTVYDSLGNVLVANSTFMPTYFENGYAFNNVYGYLNAISNKNGDIIWQRKVTEFFTENAGYMGNEICSMKDLEYFSVRGNDWDYSFHLPECFYDLKNLKRIEIKNSDLDSIPDKVSNLKQLHYLEVYSYKLAYMSPKIAELNKLDTLILYADVPLPKEVSGWKNLDYLSLNGYRIPPIPTLKTLNITADTLPAEIEKFSSLKRLEYTTKLRDDYTQEYKSKVKEIMGNVINQFSRSNSIEVLNLGYDGVSWVEVLMENADKIKSMKSLKRLEITYMYQYKDELVKVFPNLELFDAALGN